MIEGRAIDFVNGSSNGKNKRKQVMTTNTNNKSAKQAIALFVRQYKIEECN